MSLISAETYHRVWKSDSAPTLQESNVKLKTYTGAVIPVQGVLEVTVAYKDQSHKLSLVVVEGSGPSLLGRDWLRHIRLDWHQLNSVQVAIEELCENLVLKHAKVFDGQLGHLEQYTARLQVDPAAEPRFYKARPVAYALRARVEAEIDRLQGLGVIEPVPHADWAAPVVPVVKTDGSIRLCGDYKLTANQVAKTDAYPLPRIEDLFASLAKGQKFTKLDLKNAYAQVPLSDDSKKYTTINTTKGLFQYVRLPFGVAAAPAIFQRTMETVLQGIPNTCVYLDDILITGESDEQHLETLDKVLSRLEQAGARLKKEKCSFMLPAVEYLGHQISKDGLQPTDEKVRALRDAPVPRNVSQLKSFHGLLNYYNKFLPNHSHNLAPLHRLLQKNTPWIWGPEQQDAFDRAKVALTLDNTLAHYDPEKELVLACDASPYGLGVVLSHKLEDGTEMPIAYASRTLAPAEKKYSQLDKEGLAIIFGVKRFHQYLAGRRFHIQSDHKPLEYLFKETKGVPTLACAHLQRWALTLGAYDYSITYKPGPRHCNADMLSRLPLPSTPDSIPVPMETIMAMEMLCASIPVQAKQLKQWTDKDPLLSKVRSKVQTGWEDTQDPDWKPYQKIKLELSIQEGCLLRGSRVVVPPQGLPQIVEQLHEGHPGISRMKNLARSFVWWPGIDSDLEVRVKQCESCQKTRHQPPPLPVQPWEWPQRPWARIDYAGPIEGHMLLIVVDSHSKWIEVKVVRNATSAVTMEHFRAMFAAHGLPEMLVTDNGTPFVS